MSKEMHIRSLLFCPANNKELFKKALRSEADIIIFDLEDAVSKANKKGARKTLSDWLATQESPVLERIMLRINPIDTEEGKLDTLMFNKLSRPPGRIVLPKVESVKQIRTAIEQLRIPNDNVKIIPLIETAKGVANIEKIVKEADKLACLMVGNADLSADLNCDNNRVALQYTTSKVLFACALHHIVAVDSPYFNIENGSGLESDTTFGKSIGFSARSAIHPKQVPTINKIYGYSKSEIEEAQKIIEASAKGVGVVNGMMIDEAMAKRARKIMVKSDSFEKKRR